MAALTASVSRLVRTFILVSLVIADAIAIKVGSFLALRGPYHATSQGYLDLLTNAKGKIPTASFALKADTGDTSASTLPESSFSVGPQVLSAVSVTGASARTDLGKWVYMTSDNDLTLTRPSALAYPVGFTLDFNSDSSFEVLLFGMLGSLLMSAAGGAKRILHLGSYPDLGNVGTGAIRTGIPCEFHGRIVEVYGFVTTAVAGAGADIDVNLEISTNADGSSGTDVTGGVVTFVENDALGTRKDGTTVTAENVFHEGDTINVETAEQTAASAIGFCLYAVAETLPGV